jgi:uncharacterized OB-fold protein
MGAAEGEALSEEAPFARLAVPPTTPESEPFWNATRVRRLVLPWCIACNRPIWFPRAVCPKCLGSKLDWRTAEGRGVVHAVSVHHRPGPGRTEEDGPYAVALVDLEEGVRILSNIVDIDPLMVTIGAKVILRWQPLPDGRALPMFRTDVDLNSS